MQKSLSKILKNCAKIIVLSFNSCITSPAHHQVYMFNVQHLQTIFLNPMKLSTVHLNNNLPEAPSFLLWCTVPQSRNKQDLGTHDCTKQGRKWVNFLSATLFTVPITILFTKLHVLDPNMSQLNSTSLLPCVLPHYEG